MTMNRWKTAIEKDQEKGATADMERKKEVLVKKAKEYKKELDVLMVTFTCQIADLSLRAY